VNHLQWEDFLLLQKNSKKSKYTQFMLILSGQNLKLWGPRVNQNMEAPLSNKKYRLPQLCFFFISYSNGKYRLTFRDFREAKSHKNLFSVSVLQRPWVGHPSRFPLNPTLNSLLGLLHYMDVCYVAVVSEVYAASIFRVE
jgi:hypothetical protein